MQATKLIPPIPNDMASTAEHLARLYRRDVLLVYDHFFQRYYVRSRRGKVELTKDEVAVKRYVYEDGVVQVRGLLSPEQFDFRAKEHRNGNDYFPMRQSR